MPTFRYQAGNSAQTIEATDRASALRQILGRGETPTLLEEVSERQAKTAGSGGFSLGAGRVMSRKELASFVRELATAVNAGLPVIPALKTIRGSGRNEAQKEMLTSVIEQVEQGDSLADAMKQVGKPFDDLVVSLVHAGEVSGRLGEVLAHAGILLERSVKLKRSLVGALIYPLIILLLVVVAVILVVTVIVPRVLSSVAGQIGSLPWPTQVVQWIAVFFADWWWAVLLGIGGLVFLCGRAYRDPEIRLKVDDLIVRTPVLGNLIRNVAVARFTRTLGTLVGAGLPVITSLRITKSTLGNKALEATVDEVIEEVSGGHTIAEPLDRSGMFPPLLVQLVAMGEKTGRLDELLMQASEAFEEQTEQAIKLFTSVLPPLLIVVLALMVGFVLLAILLPLLEMQDAIGV